MMRRILTTPTEELWPGVSTLPDYKPNFPKWMTDSLDNSVKDMDPQGIDLLRVSYFFTQVRLVFNDGKYGNPLIHYY